ncbi:Bridge-like lipid transfer protein family member 3B-like protein [Drosera capensis]
MESILARALESTLKYWLRSFTRDQFKLQGRTVQLSNLDIDGDALHSSVGLPPALNVASAKVGKLVIVLPSVSNVQIEPVVVQLDQLDLVLEENSDPEACPSTSTQSNGSGGKSSGYGFADKIADGMTLEVQTVNLLLETRGGDRSEGGSTWTPPMASITIRSLLMYTTNENWEVVNLKEARDFSTNKQFIYVFKKLEWETLSIDLLPHPDMFLDGRLSHAQEGTSKRDADGAKRVFFGGERFLEGISGQAYITVKRTGLNDPLGLEVRLHITEAVCPAFSEPGLRALLRFLTGLYVCLNRGDVDPKSLQQSTEAAGCSIVSVMVDHIFFCVGDTEFRLDLLMQSLYLSRASVFDGENSQNLTEITIGGFFLRDTFFSPPCALIQPSMHAISEDRNKTPDFARDLFPPIYPLGDQQRQPNKRVPFISIHSRQVKPSPAPPVIASDTVIHCQPLMIHLQEESCLRLSSLLADGIVVSPGMVLPDSSIKSLKFFLEELDLTVPLSSKTLTTTPAESTYTSHKTSFAGTRLHIENFFLSESPFLSLKLLDLEKDPACFCFWKNQPVDAGQKKLTAGASYVGLSLETVDHMAGLQSPFDWPLCWRCVEVKDACVEIAMATPDGSPLTSVPPPGGVVRVGVACEKYLSNTSVEQLFFVLELYAYLGNVSEEIAVAGKSSRLSIKRSDSWNDNLVSKFPSDTAVRLVVRDLQLRFLEDSSKTIEGRPLVQFVGEDLCIRGSHITLGGAIYVSSSIRWEKIEVDCVDADISIPHSDDLIVTSSSDGHWETANGHPELRAVLWVQQEQREQSTKGVPFLDVNVVHVIPLDAKDAECHSLRVSVCIAGVRLGGGMRYTESLLHCFGVLGLDGRPGDELSRGLENLSSGPLSKIFKASPLIGDGIKENGTSGHNQDNIFSHLGTPDDVDVSVDFRDWLFALEGAEEMLEEHVDDQKSSRREERCWHTTFRSLQVKAKNSPKALMNASMKSHGSLHYPVDSVVIGIEGLETLKPQVQTESSEAEFHVNGIEQKVTGGVNLEVCMAISEHDSHDEIDKWMMENMKLSVQRPIEAVVTKDELQHLAALCKSELDSMGRIAAGVLRLLKLEGSFGQDAIDQLSNLGSEGLGRILTPKKRTNGSSANASVHQVTPSVNGVAKCYPALPVVMSLVDEVRDSQAKCDALISDLGKSLSSTQHVDSARLVAKKLASLESLLSQLRTQS